MVSEFPAKADIQMDVILVLDFLRKKIGLNPESIGAGYIEDSVRECIETSGAASAEEYVHLLNGSLSEMRRLIEAVVVKETSFFRNTTPFVTLKSYLKQFVLNKKQLRPLRILCLPCSTGEEAYSIAMVLLDMKLSANQFFILAGDISEQVLKIAEAGSYTPYSFRGEEVAFWRKYFGKQPDGNYLLKKEIRNVVSFEQVNILSDTFLPGQNSYDIIFCRNLLIYFDSAAKVKAINALSNHLSKEGVLFVGHAEGANLSHSGLVSLDYPMSFAFAWEAHAAEVNKALNIDSSPKRNTVLPAPVQKKAFKPGAAKEAWKVAPVASEPSERGETIRPFQNSKVDSDISTVKNLADAGSFDEAVTIGEKLLSEGVESAELYYLLGQVAGSSGDILLAEEHLKKAIYLEADFHDALIYISSLYNRMGNSANAASFLKRAQRVKQRKKPGAEQ